MTAPSPFENLHHVCVVVPDLERAKAFLEALGIAPWRDYPPLTDYIERDVGDDGGFLNLRYAVVDLANFQLQLVQPGPGSSPQRDRLESVGPSVFSIGFGSPDVDSAEERARERGLDPLLRGRRADGSGFTYFNTLAELGLSLLVRQDPVAASAAARDDG
jgi:catechol 2,3-dioxygenase-like lactoylglutathione lyase family enzyme